VSEGATPIPAGGSSALTIFLVAAEESGDRLGAALMRALRSRSAGHIQFVGLGGRAMSAEGLASLFQTDEIGNIGLTTIATRLPALLRQIRMAADAVVLAKPNVLVIIDSPDFTHRIARRVRRLAPAMPIVDYVAPSVWAWRPWRARAMGHYIDHVLALLPFEPAAFVRLGGPPCSYVGHPLIDELDQLRPNPHEARRRLDDPPILLVLPGSRATEIRRLAGPFGGALARVRDRYGSFEAVLPTVPALLGSVTEAIRDWPIRPRIIADAADKRTAFRIARAALAKSGTVTLELALAGVPMVTAYKVSRLDEFIARRVLSVSSVILPNLILGETIVPELLQADCTPHGLADALVPLMSDTVERRRQVDAFARLDEIMEIGRAAPSERAAAIVLKLAIGAARAKIVA
jgi:lipid-A-disaccharide synthase